MIPATEPSTETANVQKRIASRNTPAAPASEEEASIVPGDMQIVPA
jgi:hypothetical protein